MNVPSIKQLRYVGFYSGPSYGNPYTDHPSLCSSAEAFTSIRQAKAWFAERQGTSGRYPLATLLASFNEDGNITAVTRNSARWPATSPEDSLELYPVYLDDGADYRASSEPCMRITAGPRGGAVVERY